MSWIVLESIDHLFSHAVGIAIAWSVLVEQMSVTSQGGMILNISKQ